MTRSVDNNKIMMMTGPSISVRTSEQVILAELQKILDGVIGVVRINRRWLKVEFLNHQKAAIARKHTIPNTVKILGYASIKKVEWADPDIDMEGIIIHKKKLFVQSLVLPNIPEENIRRLFNSLSGGQVRDIVIGSRFGFVTFDSLQAAEEVMENRDRVWLDGERVIVDWWKPSSPSKLKKNSSVSRELTRLTQVKGWGIPQFRLEATRDINLRPGYQYSVAFSSVPFKIIGQAAEDQDLAFTNCVTVAVQEVGRKNLFLASSLPLLQYYPDSALPSIQALTI